MFKYCPNCQKNIHNDYVRDTPDGRLSFCPSCNSEVIELVPKSKARVKDYSTYNTFNLTLDQVRYLKHMNLKQHDKVAHALKQTIDIDTKLTIMEEVLMERECK